ncbi:MAG: low molecular weight protein-tyrosine-phosphatase [Dermatophilaceae bacterium]
MSAPFRITVVCTGNICRSPMAEIVLRRLLDEARVGGVVVTSGGTGSWHIGDGADARALRILRQHGYDGSGHRARQFDVSWFAQNDLILAADVGHQRALRRLAPDPDAVQKVRLLRSFDPDAVAAGTTDVDDPWYGTAEDFEQCFREVETACRGVAAYVAQQRSVSGD